MNHPIRAMIIQALLIVLVFAGLGSIANVLRADGIPFIKKLSVSNIQGIQRIDLNKAKELFDQNALFLDARTLEEYQQGHINNALNFPYDQYDDMFVKVMGNISKDTRIVTYCSGEDCNSSDILANLLKEEGFNNLFNFYGGWPGWVGAGHSVNRESKRSLYSLD